MPRRQAHHRLAVFTPGALARSLQPKAPREQPQPRVPSATSKTPIVVVDIASLAKGAVIVGEYLLHRARNTKLRQQEIRKLTLEIAQRFEGFVGIPDLLARDDEITREDARRCLSGLEDEQICRYLCHYHDEPVYVFPAFLARVWECEYCASTFAVRPEDRKLSACGCPNCGAVMRQRLAESSPDLGKTF